MPYNPRSDDPSSPDYYIQSIPDIFLAIKAMMHEVRCIEGVIAGAKERIARQQAAINQYHIRRSIPPIPSPAPIPSTSAEQAEIEVEDMEW